MVRRLEGIAKLGQVGVIEIRSSIFMPARLTHLVLKPQSQEVAREVSAEIRVAWKPEEPEMLTLPVSRHSIFSVPRYLPANIMGRFEWYELRPIIAEHAGVWHLAKYEEEVEVHGRARKIKRALSTRDFLHTGERIGVIVHRALLEEKEEHHYYAPSQGYLFSLQVSDGTEVEPGNLLVVMAIPTGRLVTEKQS